LYLFLGLKRLEYRGYDSAGLGVDDIQGNQTLLIKTLGKVALLQVIIS
jgi:glucosamine--fructose-6-phosphate aminotransferase (isomerizing)